MSSPMESSGNKNKIQISEEIHKLVKDYYNTNTNYVIGCKRLILLHIPIIHNIYYAHKY